MILKRLKSIFKFRGENDPWAGVSDAHKIVKAFDFEGETYYKFDDTFNLCSGRAFASIDYYEELRQRCTREYLETFHEAMKTELEQAFNQMVITNNELDLNKVNTHLQNIKKMNTFLGERLEFILDQDALYKLASVVYFTRDEKPYDYDYKWNIEKKIPAFKRMGADFFLLMPLKDLIPFGSMSIEDLNEYMETQKKVNDHQLKSLLSLTSDEFKKTDLYKKLDLSTNTDLGKKI